MSKTVKEKAEEWNCSPSTVRRYCKSGIIPPAEKKSSKGGWQIPDKWPKPPMTRYGLCYLLDTIFQLKNGVDFNLIKWGYSNEEIIAGYDYLIGAAFMSSIDTSNITMELVKAVVTPRGESLIKKEIEENKNQNKFCTNWDFELNLGIASLGFGGKTENTTN